MAKKRSGLTNGLIGAGIVLGGLFLMAKAVQAAKDDSPYTMGGYTPSFPQLVGSTFTSPTGETYTPSKDPIKALQYAPEYVQQAAVLQAMSTEKGRELTAKEILPVVKGLTPQQTKTAILLSSPSTLKSYSAVAAGTTTVTPQKKDSSGMTSTDRAVRSSKAYVGSKWKAA